jgi:hypothetical protein
MQRFYFGGLFCTNKLLFQINNFSEIFHNKLEILVYDE